jgi:hypothetical protein
MPSAAEVRDFDSRLEFSEGELNGHMLLLLGVPVARACCVSICTFVPVKQVK